MDQVRAIVKAIWQQRFWVLTVLGVLVAVACWYSAAGDLQSRFSTRKTAISGSINAVEVLTRGFHPNEEVIKGDQVQAVEQREKVLQVWQSLYEGQRDVVLKWPTEVLGPSFVDKAEQLQFLDDLDLTMRDNYWNNIDKRFDQLLTIVDARKNLEGSRSRRFSGEDSGSRSGANSNQDATTAGDDYLVEWLDQGVLNDLLTFDAMPSKEQVWVTQEDLWVYETLLRVIAKTNELRGASRPDNTAVREIIELKVGQPAIAGNQTPVNIYIPQTGDGIPGALGGPDIAGAAGGAPPISGGFPEGSPEQVLGNRYLDTQGQPIPGTAQEFGSEYRQLPIRLVLNMDQRWLPQLLVECANAPLPVKVDQVRINPQRAQEGIGDSNRRSSVRGSSDKKVPLPNTNMAHVEIEGVVYIYVPPNPEILDVPGVEPEQLASTEPATS